MSLTDQEQFSDLERRLRFGRTKAALLLGALMMPGGALLDSITYPQQLWQLLALRGAVSVILVLGFLVVVRLPTTAPIGRISMALLLVPAMAMAWMIYLTDGASSAAASTRHVPERTADRPMSATPTATQSRAVLRFVLPTAPLWNKGRPTITVMSRKTGRSRKPTTTRSHV